nr:Sir2 family NAD-dependent protein deacetylase [Kocuria atrinae]
MRWLIRPGVVWFGEALPERAFQESVEAVQDADLVLVVGTSGLVYPAAGIPDLAAARGVPVVEINPQASEVSASADHVWRAWPARLCPRWWPRWAEHHPEPQVIRAIAARPSNR